MTLSLYYYGCPHIRRALSPRGAGVYIYRGFKFLFLGWERERAGRVCLFEETQAFVYQTTVYTTMGKGRKCVITQSIKRTNFNHAKHGSLLCSDRCKLHPHIPMQTPKASPPPVVSQYMIEAAKRLTPQQLAALVPN